MFPLWCQTLKFKKTTLQIYLFNTDILLIYRHKQVFRRIQLPLFYPEYQYQNIL
mgnify:FL=1